VIAEAETYVELARSLQVKLGEHGGSPLHAIVAFGGAHSGLQTVISTYDKPGSAVIGVFAARMLLEEAARMGWRYSAGEAEAFKARAKHYFDEYRTKRKKTIELLVSSGVPVADAQKIFSWPDKVRVVTPDDEIDKGRPPLPSIGRMLRQMGERENYPEPGWLGVAYSLLSQITHSTPIGHLHAIRHLDGEWRQNELSPEMLGLTLDVACLGSAHTIGLSAAVLTNMSDETTEFMKKLHRQAAVVHNAARLVHGLD
jgi:hypothetical protein